MAFPPGFLDELRGRVSLSELVGRRVKLTRRGREFAGLCPFHHEKTPSFYVVEDKGFFHCFGCGAHGDAIGFVMRADNLDFLEAVEKLAGEAGLAVPQATPEEREKAQRQKTLLETLEAAAGFYEARLWSPAGAAARDYLHGARARRRDDPPLSPRLGAGRPAGAAPRARRRLSRAAAGRGGAAASARRGRAVRLFPQPGHVSDRRPRRPGHRLWRPASCGDGPAEIPEFARNPGLRKGARALRLVGGAGARELPRAARSSSPKAIWT